MGSVSRAVIGLIISCMKDKSCAFPQTLDHRVGCKLRALQHYSIHKVPTLPHCTRDRRLDVSLIT